MKLIKLVLIVLLFSFLFTACAGSNQPITGAHPQVFLDRQQHEPDEFKQGNQKEITFYVKRGPWDSPFNPHEVLRYWEKLSADQVGHGIMATLVGNPKIDWANVDRSKDPTTFQIPEGEITSSVIYVFMVLPNGQVELLGYGYKNRDGVVNRHHWSEEDMKYVGEVVSIKPFPSNGLDSKKPSVSI